MFRWELEDRAEQDLASLPPRVRQALTEFLEALILVDPMEYQRYPGEPYTSMRSLSFGPQDDGLVWFLVYPPGDLVLVVRIQWLGE